MNRINALLKFKNGISQKLDVDELPKEMPFREVVIIAQKFAEPEMKLNLLIRQFKMTGSINMMLENNIISFSCNIENTQHQIIIIEALNAANISPRNN